jgi:hypothetical protein
MYYFQLPLMLKHLTIAHTWIYVTIKRPFTTASYPQKIYCCETMEEAKTHRGL